MKQQTAYIEIELLSEAILGGGGQQKGTVDIDIQVDEYGLPYFAARTLKGVLRDRANWYVECLSEEKQPKYKNALLQLFGKADDGGEHYSNYEALRIGNAKLSESLYKVVQEEKSTLRETMKAISSIRGMTSIDDNKGTAEKRSLRQARVIHSGYTFVAPIFLNRTLSEVEKELLSISVKLLRHIGMMRNRGKGEVACTLYWNEQKEVNVVSKRVNDDDKYIYLTIDAEEPLKINDVVRTSNSTKALNYIPGHVLRGALVQAYLQDRNLTPDDLDTKHIFNPEKIQFWNGYLMIDGKRSLPFAQHLFETKTSSKSNEVVREIYNSLNKGDFELIDSQSPVRINRHMMAFGKDSITGANVELTSSLHININGPDGKRKNPLLYRYEAISPNQRFQAVIQVEEHNDFTRWLKEKNHFYVWLGGARNSGYGRSRITIKTGKENIEVPENLHSFSEDLYLLATSDWIIYNEYGQLLSAIDDKFLSEQLGATLQIDGQVVNTELSGGYISHWRAYQPMIRSVKAGSIYRYKIVNGTIDETKLQVLMKRGIGSRTNEGFGRFIALPSWNFSQLNLAAQKPTVKELEARRLHGQEREKREAFLLKRAINSERIKEKVFNEVDRWYNLTGPNTLNTINSTQWSKLLQISTDILRVDTNELRHIYQKKWETFWNDVKQRTENKVKLGYESIKIVVSEREKIRIEEFIMQYLYEKEWEFTKPNSEESIFWSLEALQLFIRKILRQK